MLSNACSSFVGLGNGIFVRAFNLLGSLPGNSFSKNGAFVYLKWQLSFQTLDILFYISAILNMEFCHGPHYCDLSLQSKYHLQYQIHLVALWISHALSSGTCLLLGPFQMENFLCLYLLNWLKIIIMCDHL